MYMKMIAYYITKLNVYSFILNMKDAENCNNTILISFFYLPFFKLSDTRDCLRDTTGDGYVSYTVADVVHTSNSVSILYTVAVCLTL